MYDITNEKTFHNIKYWIAQIEEHAFQAGMTTSEQSLPGMIIKLLLFEMNMILDARGELENILYWHTFYTRLFKIFEKTKRPKKLNNFSDQNSTDR